MITLDAVSKSYRSLGARGTVTALSELSLEVSRGEVVGVAGPNGAGKSTMISLILGYLQPTAGRVRIDGLAPRAYAESSGAGYLTELVALPPRWTVVNALERFASLGGLGPLAPKRIDEALEVTGLDEHKRKAVKQLSKGTMQRLGLALALLGERDLIILDEPTHGLDPLWTQRFRDIVRLLRRDHRAIVIASHNLDELERITDRVAIINKGRLQRVVRAGEGSAASAYRLVLAAPFPDLTALFPAASEVEGRTLEFRIGGDLAALNAALAELIRRGGQVAGFYAEESQLAREFRAAVGEDS